MKYLAIPSPDGLRLEEPVIRELLMAYERFGCTDDYWEYGGGKQEAVNQVDAFLNQTKK